MVNNESEKFMENDIVEKKEDNHIYKEILKYYSKNSNKRKIVLVGHSGGNCGAEILLKNLIIEFKRQGVEVSVLVKFDGPIIEEYKKYAPTFIIDTVEKIEYHISELSKFGYQSAILNTTLCGDLSPVFHKYNVYCISLVHELPGMIKLLSAEAYVKIIAEESDLTIFPSNYVCKKFEEMYKVQKQKLIQPQGFYNSYDKFNKVESRKKLVEKYNIPEDNHIILNVGSGELRKGFDLFIDIAKKLKNEKYTFIWVGAIDEDMEKLYADELNNTHNLICTGFLSNKDEIMCYYDACDIFLLTSREDPFPSVVLEAFNAKKPVIGFENAGGFCDIVINDKSGFLVKYESVDEMIDKIHLICEDDKLNEHLGINAKKICEQHSFHEYVKIINTYSLNGEFIIFLENEIRSRSNKITYLEKEYEKSNKQYEKNISIKNKEISKLKRKNKKLTREKNEILSSSSWKITKPIRGSKKYAKNLLKLKNKFKSENNSPNIKTNNNQPVSNNKKQKGVLKNNYSVIKTYPYQYKIYMTNENLKRVNIFYDEIDERIYEQTYLFRFIIEFCNKFHYSLRIIYNNADFDKFNFFIKDNHLKLPTNLSFLNLKKENYLEIGLNEKYICTSWKNAKSLMNNGSFNSIIYYYLEDLTKLNDVDYFRTVNICYKNNTVILTDDIKKLKELKHIEYDYDIEFNNKLSNDYKILCCDFGDMVIEGIEILNYLFLNNILDINKWKVNIFSKQKISNLYSDSNNIINHITKDQNNVDLLLKINNKKSSSKNKNMIRINFKKVNNDNYNFLNIFDINEIYYFNKFVPSDFNKSNELFQIGEIFNNINGVN